MNERPILFSGSMVCALLAGRKTQTRRIIKDAGQTPPDQSNLRYVPGDRLWVKETWAVGMCAEGLKPSYLSPGCWMHDNGGIWYRADGAVPKTPISIKGKWRPSLFMPRWASRLTLDVTDVRVERLRDISEDDAIAEGVTDFAETWDRPGSWEGLKLSDRIGLTKVQFGSARNAYRALWEMLNGENSWEKNPYVVAISFRVATPALAKAKEVEAA